MPTPLWKKGQSGNPKGRPPKPEIENLRIAIATVEKKKKKKLLVHYVEQAFEDNPTLQHLVGRLLPALKAIEAEVTAKHSGKIEISWKK